jgi:hypothetical protein
MKLYGTKFLVCYKHKTGRVTVKDLIERYSTEDGMSFDGIGQCRHCGIKVNSMKQFCDICSLFLRRCRVCGVTENIKPVAEKLMSVEAKLAVKHRKVLVDDNTIKPGEEI